MKYVKVVSMLFFIPVAIIFAAVKRAMSKRLIILNVSANTNQKKRKKRRIYDCLCSC